MLCSKDKFTGSVQKEIHEHDEMKGWLGPLVYSCTDKFYTFKKHKRESLEKVIDATSHHIESVCS